jgi:hypothetical protein
VHVKLSAEKSFDPLQVVTVVLVVAGSALPIYSLAMLLIDSRVGPPMPPDAGWAIMLTGAYVLMGVPSVIMTYLGRARRTAFVLSLLCAFAPFSLFLAMVVVAARMGGE